jgi:hypothetical protein
MSINVMSTHFNIQLVYLLPLNSIKSHRHQLTKKPKEKKKKN